MKTKQIAAGVAVVLAALTFWVAIPIALPVILLGAAILIDEVKLP